MSARKGGYRLRHVLPKEMLSCLTPGDCLTTALTMDGVTTFILRELAFDGDLGKCRLVAGSIPPLVELSGSAMFRFKCIEATTARNSILYHSKTIALANRRR